MKIKYIISAVVAALVAAVCFAAYDLTITEAVAVAIYSAFCGFCVIKCEQFLNIICR